MNKDLKVYIQREIKRKYKFFDKAHNISHFNFVVNNCVNYAKQLIKQNIILDLDIAYIVGAYHDVGIICGREDHAKSSGRFVRQDLELKKYYDDDTIELIAQAVEDHTSKLDYEPRNIYGKIVSDADRNNSLYLVFSRPIKYGLQYKPNDWTKEQHIERVYSFVNKKYGKNGYVHYWLNISDTKNAQSQVWALLDDESKCKAYISGLFDEITKGKY